MKLEHFDECRAWWGSASNNYKKRVENRWAWKVGIDEIKQRNYNLDIKNPHVEEQEVHDPDELLAQYTQQQQEIQALRDQLKTILGEALTQTTGLNKKGKKA